ncbi:MAG: helix-turn-helix transcriptional regulator [Alphaproteobacteria bacterium]|nr:helix-turn-helix transcriptional regulator [Alphaproteobacteria bacterium]
MDKRPAHPEVDIPSTMSPEAVRQEFARRLQRMMIAKGWNQSELARRAAPYMPDKAMVRDSISKYIRARSLPGPLALTALSKALGCQPDDLLPVRPAKTGNPIDREIETLDAVCRALNSVQPEERSRILGYMKSKFSAEWPGNRH